MEKCGNVEMNDLGSSSFFFSGSHSLKLDDKGRFVLPHAFRLGLVENGRDDFVMCLGLGKSLCIYKRSDMEKMVQRFKEKQHIAKYQPFFTTFFSNMHQTKCDTIGRTSIPQFLKQIVGIEKEIVVCGVLNKIEIWPKKVYEQNLQNLLEGKDEMKEQIEEAFALLDEGDVAPKERVTEDTLSRVGKVPAERT